MKSMTGYGRGIATCDCGTMTVEVSAVNSRKQVDLRCAVPRELGNLEQQIRQCVQKKLSRGSLYVAVSYQLNPEALTTEHRLDEQAFLAAAKELAELSAKAGMAAPTVRDVLCVPGVAMAAEQGDRLEPLKALLEPALESALAEFDKARVAEGLRLKEDLVARGETVRTLLENIDGRGNEALKQLQERLRARLVELGATLSEDDERLAKELVFFAERADITEEVVRLKSHIVKYFQLLDSEEPGRELDFLGQEMNREITTLSSKTADLCISADALAMKVEISKIREQIMNIE